MSNDNNDKVFDQGKILVHGCKVESYLRTGRTGSPVTMELDLTNKCNNACPSCTGYNDDSLEMDGRLASRLIGEFSDAGVDGLIFTGGGEPLLHKGLSSLVEQAYSSGLSTGVITSGQSPKSFGMDDLVKIVKGSSWMRLSLDAGSEGRYLKTHGLKGSSYSKALNFLSASVEAKDFTESDCTVGVGYLTGLGSVVDEQLDIHKSVIECAVRGADYFQLRPFHGSKRVVDFSDRTKDYIKHHDMKLLASNHKYDSMGDDSRGYDYCHGASFASVVTADGGLYVCCHARNQPWGYVGNLTNKDFKSVWDSGALQRKVDGIDVDKCVKLCRADGMNKTLEGLLGVRRNGHKDFL